MPYIRVKRVKDSTYFYLEEKVPGKREGSWTTHHLGKASPEDIQQYGDDETRELWEGKQQGGDEPTKVQEDSSLVFMPEKVSPDSKKVVELFSGTAQFSRVANKQGFQTLTVDNNQKFKPDICMDIMDLTPEMIKEKIDGEIFFLWASPPCQCFSIASKHHHWKKDEEGNYLPQDDDTRHSIKLVRNLLNLIRTLKPKYWVIENPMGMLRVMPWMKNLNGMIKQPWRRSTVTYCQYGMKYQKPTDIWNNVTSWIQKERCKRGDPCHIPSPRGSSGGLQNIHRSPMMKAVVPQELCEEIFQAALGRSKTSQNQLPEKEEKEHLEEKEEPTTLPPDEFKQIIRESFDKEFGKIPDGLSPIHLAVHVGAATQRHVDSVNNTVGKLKDIQEVESSG